MLADTGLSPEDFRNYAQGVQAVLISLGVLIGAIWALFKFGIIKEKERARVELERLSYEALRHGGIEKSASIESHLKKDGAWVVNVSFFLKNLGTRILVCYYSEPPFLVSRMRDKDGEVTYEKIYRRDILHPHFEHDMDTTFPASIRLHPNVPVTFTLSCELHEPGSYMFSLILKRDNTDPDIPLEEVARKKRLEHFEKFHEHPEYNKELLNFSLVDIHKPYYLDSTSQLQVKNIHATEDFTK